MHTFLTSLDPHLFPSFLDSYFHGFCRNMSPLHLCTVDNQWYHPSWKNSGLVREYMSSLSVYRNTWYVTRPLNCMVLKVIPADRLETFKLRHYYRSRDSKQSTASVFDADEFTRQGVDYTNVNRKNPKVSLSLPSCWKEKGIKPLHDPPPQLS